MVRINLAGELGAQLIYLGQLRGLDIFYFLGHRFWSPSTQQKFLQGYEALETMYLQEIPHGSFFKKYSRLGRIRGSYMSWLMYPLGYLSGFLTGLGGVNITMALVHGIESVVEEHYEDQIQALDRHLGSDYQNHPFPDPNFFREFPKEITGREKGPACQRSLQEHLAGLKTALKHFQAEESQHRAAAEPSETKERIKKLSGLFRIFTKGFIKLAGAT